MFAKDKTTKDSAPGALIVHILGGIHEIYFPYVLMNPLLLLATIGGSVAAMFFNTLFNVGLVSPASPGSILAMLAVAPKGGQILVIISFLIATAVSFLIASPIVKMSNGSGSLEDAQSQMSDMKAASKGQGGAYAATADGGEVDLRTLDKIVFACDAGMGSSAMGAAVLQKKLEAAGLGNIKVQHFSVSEVPAGIKFVVCHQDLVERARKSAPTARIVTISNFMNAPQYDQIVQEILDAKSNKNVANAGGHDFHGGVLAVLHRAEGDGDVVAPVRADVHEVEVLLLAERLVGVFRPGVFLGGGHAAPGEDGLAFGHALGDDVAEGGNDGAGNVGQAFHGVSAAHAEADDTDADGLEGLGPEADDILLAGRARGNVSLQDGG